MNHAITMGIFLAFDRGRQCRLFLCPVQESKTLVVGNHVVGRGIVSWLILPSGHQRHAVTRLLGLLPLF